MRRRAIEWQQVDVGGAVMLVNTIQPVAIVRREGKTDFSVSWPDLDVGFRSPSMTVLRAPTGAWVVYRPVEAEDPATAQGVPAAIHLAPDGALTCFERIGAEHVVGTTRHGLWLNTSALPNRKEESAWSSKNDLVVLAADGSQQTVTVDRRAAFAVDDGEHAELILYASAPDVVRSAFGGMQHMHQFVQVGLPPHELPLTIDVAEHARTLDKRRLVAAMSALAPQVVLDGPTDPGVRWSLVALSRSDQEAAVAAVQREFADLTDYWRQDDGDTSPLSHGLSDAHVEAVGDWPHSRVEVSFCHPHFPEGRLRRIIRVFDQAGRVAPAPYASIHLMEDLATGKLPSTDSAHDGVLEI